MKGNLLKKIGAIATTVAMIASVSVTGFAAGVVYNTEAEGAQDITGKPIMATETDTAGIYKVEIPYKSNVANTIGVTMLSYASTGNGTSLEANQTTYGEGMQIVGIDQINAGDANNNTIGANGTGKFTFYVSTLGAFEDEYSATNTDGVIRMDRGERGIVLLSGDAAASATGYLFQVGKAAGVVTVNGAGGTTTTVEVVPADGTGEAYIKEMITTTPYSVQINGNNVAADKVTVTAKGADYNADNWQAQNVVYTVSVNDDAYDVTPAEIEVTYLADPWTATSVEVAGVTVAKDDIQNGDLGAAVKAAIKSVTLADGNSHSAVVAVDEDDIEVTVGTYTESDEEATYTASVKVLKGQYDRFTVNEAGVTDSDVTVTVSVTKWDIASIALVEGTEATIAAGEVAYESAPANEEAILTAVKKAYENKVVAKSVDGKSGAVAADKVTVTKKDGSYNKETKTAQTVTYTIGIADGTSVSGSNAIADASALTIDVTYTITVTGHPAPAFIPGDVNDDKSVDVMDASAVQMYAFFNTPLTIPEAGDVNGDDSVDVMDASAIQMYAFFNTPFPTSN